MIKCRVKVISEYRRETTYIHKKCGHLQEFTHTIPYNCGHIDCREKMPRIDKLFGRVNQDVRVKFFATGEIC